MGEGAGPLLDPNPAGAVQVATVDKDPDQLILTPAWELRDAVVEEDEPWEARSVHIILGLVDKLLHDIIIVVLEPFPQRDVQPIPDVGLYMVGRAYEPDPLAVTELSTEGEPFV